MTIGIFSKISYKLFVLLLSVFYSFNAYVGPTTNEPIKPSDYKTVKMTFAAWADPQVSNYILKREPYFDAACEDIKNAESKIDAMIMAGDIVENGLLCEYEYVTEHLLNSGVKNYIFAVGNHDVRMKIYNNTVKTFTKFLNTLNENANNGAVIDSLHYTYNVNGYTFIVLGTDRTEFEESYFNNAQLEWLDNQLAIATSNKKPAFVICHQSLKNTHGLPDTWNSPFDAAGSVGDQSDELYNIMNKYSNVFFLTGHLHTGIGQYTYEKLGKINSINLPSLTIDNKDGDCNENGIGFMVEVYSNKVIFRARNFAQGKYIPERDISIPLV